ncbi:MAG: hypothetical protein M1484_02210 [Patescibacteria group bacterium]|nr:hypothetical protein [Patescibacteria group bacterium]
MKCAFPEKTGVADCPPAIEPFRAISPDFSCEICLKATLLEKPGLLVLASALNVDVGEKTLFDLAIEYELERRNLPVRDVDDGYPRTDTFNIWSLLSR